MIAATSQLGLLPPIALDELVDRASLLTRLDRKYILPATDLQAVLGGLPGDVRALEIDRRRVFAYRSLYFDTPGLDSYLAAAHRRRRRFKIRIRSYLDSGTHFAEVKTPGRRGTTVKQRIPHTGGPHLGPEARAHADAVLADASIPGDGLRFGHVLTTLYSRATLFVPSTGSRVTVDTDLTWALPDGSAIRIPDRVIVETKSARTTSEVDRLLWSLGHRPCPVSKYATGLAALRPDLPANRWRPVLRRHFPTLAMENR
ncbi:VTC domain-containing protein [Planobispora takensis]|uniref:VTC domain-containing protein n=1 Tax=Planobispora takensis TaxID=1367882 RepID=A0A8J3T761_9ACTN|nr:VTC domain-containing protein [Planobispora takensis]GII05671.1 VTC domain-containing protein [Planobispora takensis]